MKLIISLAALFFASTALAQTPLTKRAVNGSTVRATALTPRITTASVEKTFFVAYGGQVFVDFKVRSDGAHPVNWQAYFGTANPCSGGTSSATYQGFGCGADITAGGKITVLLFANGQQGAICCVRLKFSLVDVNTPAITLAD